MLQVWVIDDDTAIRELLYDALTHQGHEVMTIGSGAQALEMLKGHRPQLILLDSTMPGMSGLETAREIRVVDDDVPIVLLKALDEHEASADELGQVGIEEIVPKNANAEQFTNSVAVAMRRVQRGSKVADEAPAMRVPGTLLIVDDDPQILRLMMAFFTSRGLKVLLANSGEEAIKAATQKPTAVLLDVNMPGMDGLMTLKKLRGAYPDLPVVMVSGVGEDATVREALEAGADDYVVKPFSLEYLETVVLTKILLGMDDE